MNAIDVSTDNNEPITVSFMHSYALPSMTRRCAGRTDKAVSASGTPRSADGIKSRKVCVTASAIIKITRTNGEVKARKKDADDKTISETKLTWMPGIKPVMIPAPIPQSIAKNISENILCGTGGIFRIRGEFF